MRKSSKYAISIFLVISLFFVLWTLGNFFGALSIIYGAFRAGKQTIPLLFTATSSICSMLIVLLLFHSALKLLVKKHKKYEQELGQQQYEIAWFSAYGPLFSSIIIIVAFIPFILSLAFLKSKMIYGTTAVTIILGTILLLLPNKYPRIIRIIAAIIMVISLGILVHFLFFSATYQSLFWGM